MHYWITSHWPPHGNDEIKGPFYAGVWVQDGRERVAMNLKEGDLIFKYESKSGQSRVDTLPVGSTRIAHCVPGRQGIVGLMEATDDLHGDPESKPTEYGNGTTKWWRFHAPAKVKDAEGFVSLSTLNRIMGYSPGNVMRGFGDANSGLKKISKETFDELYHAFKQSRPTSAG